MKLRHPATGDVIEVTSNVDGWLAQGWLSPESAPLVGTVPDTGAQPVPVGDKEIPSTSKGKK